jgi:hypothetical protein
MEPFWFFVGIVAALPMLGPEPDAAVPEPVESTRNAPAPKPRPAHPAPNRLTF